MHVYPGMDLDPEIVDEIYEAAAVPELWPRLLERIAALAEAKAAGLLAYDEAGLPGYVTTRAYDEGFKDFVANGLGLVNVRPRRALALYPHAFATDLEVCTLDELAQDPIYVRFLKPHGFDWTAGTAIPVPSGDLLVIDLARDGSEPFRRETMQRLDAYRPHLARAAFLAHRLGLHAARNQAEALEVLGLPSAVLDRRGRLLAANALFEHLAPRVVFRANGGVSLAERSADRLLGSAIEAAARTADATVRSIPVRAGEQEPALVVHVVPVRRAGGDIFARAAVLLTVTPVTMPDAPLREVLHGLFDLTPAEAKVAAAVASGVTLEGMAAVTAVSVETIRTQLKSVMAKTGTNRQTELALLLAGTRLGRSPG